MNDPEKGPVENIHTAKVRKTVVAHCIAFMMASGPFGTLPATLAFLLFVNVLHASGNSIGSTHSSGDYNDHISSAAMLMVFSLGGFALAWWAFGKTAFHVWWAGMHRPNSVTGQARLYMISDPMGEADDVAHVVNVKSFEFIVDEDISRKLTEGDFITVRFYELAKTLTLSGKPFVLSIDRFDPPLRSDEVQPFDLTDKYNPRAEASGIEWGLIIFFAVFVILVIGGIVSGAEITSD